MSDANKLLNSPTLLVTSSPHLHEGTKTRTIMWTVVIALLPATAWGIYVFGLNALAVVLVSIFTAVLTELIISLIKHKITVLDGSAFLTGLLIGLNMPPQVPLYIPAIASLFAIAVVKQAFGGLGSNWMNPALAGRVFVMFSFQGPMSTWQLPRTLLGSSLTVTAASTLRQSVDAITSASPLMTIKNSLTEITSRFADPLKAKEYLQSIGGPLQVLSEKNYPVSEFALQIANWLNSNLGLKIQASYLDLFFGNIPGCIGEISAFLLLFGAGLLFIRRIISWEIPLSMLGSFSLLVWLLGGLRFGAGLGSGDVAFQLFSGGLILGAFFMATDYVTSPLSRIGKIVFGLGCGVLTFLIRFYGSLPEGVSLAIIIMNMTVPLIDSFFKPKIFGRKKGERL